MESVGHHYIDGPSLCNRLNAVFGQEELWNLAAIETLSEANSSELGKLWMQVQQGPVTLSTEDLCNALCNAYQVITLDLSLASDEATQIQIDDGVAVLDQLGK
jgi:hypothetical protein